MTDNKKEPGSARQLPEIGEHLSRNEIMQILSDEGYSADGRMGWLKKVLTRLAKDQEENPDGDRVQLVAEIKDILRKNAGDDPEADDNR